MDRPFEPPRVRDIARATGIAEAEVRSVLKKVARIGEVTLVAHDHFFLTDAVRSLADIADELARGNGAARAAPFRDRIGGGRKVAIQILEFFDRVGYTRRVRDDHLLRRDNPWREGGADVHSTAR
jgi:selenocysteine-specific elongation factor